MQLHSLEIPVRDMGRACAFYAGVLDFPEVSRRGDALAIFFLGDVHGGMVTLVPTDEPIGDGTTFVLEVDEEIDGVRARLEQRGARFLGPTEDRGLGRIAYLRDPEGNRIAIHQRTWPPRLREFSGIAPADVPGALETLEARTFALLGDIDEERARRAPAPGEWTAIDHLGHIVDSLQSCGEIATALARGRQPAAGGLWQPGYPAASLNAALVEGRRAFDEARAWLAALPPSPDLAAKLPHGVFGPLDCRQWVGFMLFHIDLHLDQVEALTAAAGR